MRIKQLNESPAGDAGDAGRAGERGVGRKGRGWLWSAEREQILRRLWAQGRSASEIARELGEGLTRNAVLGKVHREKLARRPSWQENLRAPTGAAADAAAALPGTPPPGVCLPEPLDELRCDLAGLEPRACRWPYGDGPFFLYCGAPAQLGRSYCPYHDARAHQAPLELSEPERARRRVQARRMNKRKAMADSVADNVVAPAPDEVGEAA